MTFDQVKQADEINEKLYYLFGKKVAEEKSGRGFWTLGRWELLCEDEDSLTFEIHYDYTICGYTEGDSSFITLTREELANV